VIKYVDKLVLGDFNKYPVKRFAWVLESITKTLDALNLVAFKTLPQSKLSTRRKYVHNTRVPAAV
jgi:hypothetical protein